MQTKKERRERKKERKRENEKEIERERVKEKKKVKERLIQRFVFPIHKANEREPKRMFECISFNYFQEGKIPSEIPRLNLTLIIEV